ncbi:MAG: ATP synthase F1 subunit gamma [Vicinamibacteria bacterium]|nr:ATP synthase F1 subunit gamma [Vicinamibacteria bacterium]
MPALIDIRRRIRSVKNTQQITKAMKMVSAAKLRRAQEAMFAARPYARRMMQVLNSLASRASTEAHPLLVEREQKDVLLIVVTSDKGLCGGFNANITRAALRFLQEEGRESQNVQLEVIGRKARDFFRRRQWPLHGEHVGVFQPLRYETAKTIAHRAIEGFTSGRFDAVYVVFNEFKSVIAQRVAVERLLPIAREEFAPENPPVEHLYEPDAQRIFDQILPRHVEVQVWQALLESAAAEHGARMAAMDAATNNAGEMIDSLTLYMNKVRQAAITKEIIEVVSGASS